MTAIYSIGHFFVDFACAAVMFRLVRRTGVWTEGLLLYNFFAFAMQAPFGLIADRYGGGKWFAFAGSLLCSASFLAGADPLLVCVTAGTGNALFHIGGGRDTLKLSGGKAGLLGVFVSPGAFGLFLGTLAGRSAVPLWPAAAAPAIAALWTALRCHCVPRTPVSLRPGGRGAAVLAALFLVVALRSYTGFLFAFPWKTGLWAYIFILCVVLGKAAGGFLHDRFGPGPVSAVSLTGAAALFLLSGTAPIGCAAVLLFNMTMPVTLRLAADTLPDAPGFSFGLLTLALFLGFLPVWSGLPGLSSPAVYTGLSLLSLALLLPASKGRIRS